MINSNEMEIHNANYIINKCTYEEKQIEGMDVNCFLDFAKQKLPLKLYKYFPNTISIDDKTGEEKNYSQIALENNTVHVNDPQNFDDIFDSNIHCEKDDFIKYRLIVYCRRCAIPVREDMDIETLSILLSKNFKDHYDKSGNMDDLFTPPLSVVQRNSDIEFLLKLRINLDKVRNWRDAILMAVENQYDLCLDFIGKQFKIACFSSTPFSTLMWGGSYGDCHRGFCVEYSLNTKLKCNGGFNLSDYIMPLIYCTTRPNIAKILAENEDQTPNEQWLWNIMLHGILRKDINWSFQDEWRFWAINGAVNKVEDNVEFYPITKVYLGNRMEDKKIREIVEICNNRKIPYVGVRMKADVFGLEEFVLK